MSTNAPKSARLMTWPLRTSPGLISASSCSFCASRVSLAAAHFDLRSLADHAPPLLLRRLAAFRAAPARRAQLRGRDEAAHIAQLDDQPALVEAGDGAAVDFLGGQQLLGLPPVFFFASAGQRQHNVAAAIFGIHDVDRDDLVNRQRGPGGLVQRVQLAAGNDALRFGAHIHQDFGGRDAGDLAVADFSALWHVHALIGIQQGLHGMHAGDGLRCFVGGHEEGLLSDVKFVRHYTGESAEWQPPAFGSRVV